MGKGIADAFYDGAYARLDGTGGSSTVETEPFWKALKTAYAVGKIQDAAAAKEFIQKWKPATKPANVLVSDGTSLPKELSGAKPRWANGAAVYLPQFESDVDKAFYIIGQKTPSKSDAQYRAFLEKQGFAADKLESVAQAVRQNVRAIMESAKPGTNLSPAKVSVPKIDLPTTAGIASTPKPKTASKKNPLAKAGKPPKTEAPADTSGQEGVTPAPTDSTPATREVERDTVARLAPSLEAVEARDLAVALKLSREGDPSMLKEMLDDLVEAEEITKAEAAEFRKAGAPQTPAEQGLTEQPIELSATQHTDFESLWKSVLANKGDAADVLAGMAQLPDLSVPEEWLANKLIDAVRASKIKVANISQEILNQAKEQNLTINGAYSQQRSTIYIVKYAPETFLHEALHSVTAEALYGEAKTEAARKLQTDMAELLYYVRNYIRTEMPVGTVSGKLYSQFGNAKGPVGNIRELVSYGLTHPEFRELLSTIPAPNKSAAANAWQAFKDIIANFLGAKKEERSFLDALIDAVGNTVDFTLNNTGEVSQMRADSALGKINPDKGNVDTSIWNMYESAHYEASDIEFSATKNSIDVTPVTRAQRLGEIFLQAAYGIERSVQLVTNAKGIITPENNPYVASRKYTSDIAEIRSTDAMEVVEPIRNWIADNWRSFRSADIESFRQDFDKFLQNYHALNERNPSLWAETVKLRDGEDVTRAALIDDANEGKITGKQLQTKLRDLAEKYGDSTLEEWAKDNPSRDPDRARKALDDVAKRGFTPENLKDFNALLQAARNRARQRMQESGVVSEEDPFADRGWEWYVPLKGSLATDSDAADMDIGFSKGSAKEFRNRNLKTLEGRKTNANNALEQMLVDLGQAGTMAAETQFKATLFEYVLDNADLLGAQIRRWTGTPKQGYETETSFTKGGAQKNKPRSTAELPQPKFGFIYNDGMNHFEVRLPEGSQLDRGVKGLRKIAYPSDLEQNYGPIASALRAVGTTTNVLARSYTTWSPTWQLTTAFLRDVNALPMTIAIESFDSPWQARAFLGHYTANLASNVFNFKNAVAEAKWINGDKSELRKVADKDPTSYAARLLAYREAGGSTEYSQSFNRETANSELFDKARNKDANVLSLANAKKTYDKVNELTGNWATVLESKARVAAWEALIAAGKDPKEAASLTKGAMDFTQSGEWGKMINNFIMFSRVGFTSMDVIRRVFTNKTGGFDKAKASKWIPAIAGMGAGFYMLLASMLGDDEDGEPLIKKISADTLTQALVLPDGSGGVFRTPIGLGLPQLLMAPGILAAAVSEGHVTPMEATRAYYETITRNTPIQPAGWRKGSGPAGFANAWLQAALPSVARPVAEVATNTNAFDGAIRTDWPSKGKFASDQGMPNTPEFWKELAKQIHEGSNGVVDPYPETLRHMSKAYGGQTANDIFRWTMDFNEKEAQGLDSRAARTTLRTAVADPDFYYASEARKISEELQISTRLKNRAANGDDDVGEAWLSANPNDAKRIVAGKALDKAYKSYGERNREIKANTLMSTQGKKDQRKLNDSKLRQAVEQARKVLETTED